MRDPVPAHYLSFRVVLALVLIAALAGAVWWIAQPEVWREVLRFLRV
ncbi:MAG: hypothetical protein M3228_01625 [Actinomycetota bacterium]|nr:hypothetical protein [Actinomycetota bacterium]